MVLPAAALPACPLMFPYAQAIHSHGPTGNKGHSSLGQGQGRKWHKWIHSCGAAPPRSIFGWPTRRFAQTPKPKPTTVGLTIRPALEYHAQPTPSRKKRKHDYNQGRFRGCSLMGALETHAAKPSNLNNLFANNSSTLPLPIWRNHKMIMHPGRCIVQGRAR